MGGQGGGIIDRRRHGARLHLEAVGLGIIDLGGEGGGVAKALGGLGGGRGARRWSRVASSSTSFSRSRRAAEATRTSAWHCRFCTYFSPARIHSHSIRTTASIFALCGHNSDSSASPTAIAEATNHPLIDVIADSTNRLIGAATTTSCIIPGIGSSAADTTNPTAVVA
uniref:Uncharacterized protein n=1 Tax=Oryza sativa subsp. japonica TaxID=39947 RepID=Q6Z8X2_ORYSJ|nr:hypothetical protein [Oryza sativa Japonica Group]